MVTLKKYYLIKVTLAIFFAVQLSSCAILLNDPRQTIRITADTSITIKIDTAIKYKSYSKNHYTIPRSQDDVKIFCETKDTTYTYLLKSNLSAAFYSNIFFNYGFGMLLDWHYPTKWDYKFRNYLSVENNKISNQRFKPYKQNTWNVYGSLPYINLYSVSDRNYKAPDFGFFGLAGGIEYFVKPKLYLSTEFGLTSSAHFPIPAPVKYSDSGYYSGNSSSYINLRINKILYSSFEGGVGLSATKFNYFSGYREDRARIRRISGNYWALGLSTTLQLRLTKNIKIGVRYQPSFYNFNYGIFRYSHSISFEIMLRLKELEDSIIY